MYPSVDLLDEAIDPGLNKRIDNNHLYLFRHEGDVNPYEFAVKIIRNRLLTGFVDGSIQ